MKYFFEWLGRGDNGFWFFLFCILVVLPFLTGLADFILRLAGK